jgi:hypothetical protein
MKQAEEENNFGCFLYTPDPGYRGLDSFSYHWVYDEIDYVTGQVVGRATSNTATESIQVGNWVDLVPANSYAGPDSGDTNRY